MKEPENLLLTFRRKMTVAFLIGMLSVLLVKNKIATAIIITAAIIILGLI